jgi:pilus assembly protein CpaE
MPYPNDENVAPQTAVVTVCTGERFAEHLREAFEQRSWNVHFSAYEAYLSVDRRPALSTLRSSQACIAFVDFDVDPVLAAATVQYLTSVLSGRLTIVAVVKTMNAAVMLHAMRAGCGEVLQRDATENALFEALQRLEAAETSVTRTSMPSGSLLSFFGAKGGVGTTTLALHLATFLIHLHKKRVLVIDYHAELGHVSVYLGLDGSRCQFQDLVRNVGRLDSELLRGFVARHSSGLDVLSSPDVCGRARPVDQDAIARTLDFLRGEYDYVILDCGRPNAELYQPAIAASSLIYLVATPEVGAIRDLSRYVDTLIPADGSSEKVQVVLNRVATPYSIEVSHIERAMKLSIAIQIASSYPELVRASNLGEPILPSAKSEIAGQFTRWANALVGTAAAKSTAAKKSKGIFAMFGKA